MKDQGWRAIGTQLWKNNLMRAGLGKASAHFLYSFVSSLNFKLNTKRYVAKVFLSPFVYGMVMAQNLARWYRPMPPHVKPSRNLWEGQWATN